MKETCEEIRGSKDSKIILKNSISNLKKVGFNKIDYLKICDLTLEELESSEKAYTTICSLARKNALNR